MSVVDLGTGQVLGEVNADLGSAWTLERLLAGGFQSGAYLVSDGRRRAVLKWTSDPGWAEVVLGAAPVVSAARSLGWPTPAWLAVGRTRGGGAYQLQEHAAGRADEHVTLAWVEAVLPVIDRQAGAAPTSARDWTTYDHELVTNDPSGTAARLAGSGAAGAGLVRSIQQLCGSYPDVRWRHDDLVHGDLNPGNVLLVDGAVTAVVDVEAIGCGSRVHDLATVIAYAALWSPGHEAVDRVLTHLRTLAVPGELEVSLSAVLLDLLAFGLDHWPAADFAAACRVAQTLVDGAGTAVPL